MRPTVSIGDSPGERSILSFENASARSTAVMGFSFEKPQARPESDPESRRCDGALNRPEKIFNPVVGFPPIAACRAFSADRAPENARVISVSWLPRDARTKANEHRKPTI
jgi:hypothetical protein